MADFEPWIFGVSLGLGFWCLELFHQFSASWNQK
jgi:hypothetical protein